MRYYFDLREGEDVVIDEQGSSFPSLQAVQHEAALSLAHMARDAVERISHASNHNMQVEVRDEHGPLFHLKLSFDLQHVRPKSGQGSSEK